MERFKGFPKEAVPFFDELEANNTRGWFHAHKDVYARACREPMQALMAELEPKYGEWKIFRINRDTRFAADKSPYKTNIAAVFGHRNYISLSPEGLYVGSGIYMPGPETLAKYRDAVADDGSGTELEKVAAALDRKGYELASHDTLRTAPKGYPKNHPRVRFLRLKGLFAGRGYPPGAWLASRKAFERVTSVLADLRPLNAWLDRHVG